MNLYNLGHDEIEVNQTMKKRYYVSFDVGPRTGQIHDQPVPHNPHYDYEIEATPEQLEQLEALFHQVAEDDTRTFYQAHIPYQTVDRMQASRQEDQQINAVYQMIYQLGTEQTKQVMREAGLPYHFQ